MSQEVYFTVHVTGHVMFKEDVEIMKWNEPRRRALESTSVAGKAYKAISCPTPCFKDRTLANAAFLAEGKLISASAVPHSWFVK